MRELANKKTGLGNPSPVKFSGMERSMTAEEFVTQYFNFRAVASLDERDIHTAASILLAAHNRFYVRPDREAIFLRELRNAIESKIRRS